VQAIGRRAVRQKIEMRVNISPAQHFASGAQHCAKFTFWHAETD